MRKFYFNIVLFIGFITQVISSPANVIVQAKIDSLENILYNSLSYDFTTQEKINICLELSKAYEFISADKQVEYAARALILAEEINDEPNLINSVDLLSAAYFKLNNYSKSIEYATRLYNIYHTNNNEIEAAKAQSRIAANYYNWSNFVKAKDYYERALNVFKKNQDFEGIAATLNQIAQILGLWGEYDEALVKNQDALKFWEEIGDQNGMAISYLGIGKIYGELEDFDRAFEYYHKSLNIYESLRNTEQIVNLTLHIGDNYLRKGLFNKALEYFFKASELGNKLQNEKLKSFTLSSIGQAYNIKGEYEKALSYQKQALVLKEDIGDKMSLSSSYSEMGLIYFNMKNYSKALDYMQKALEISKAINFRYQINKCNFHLSEIYSQLGDYNKAFDSFKSYFEGKEQIYSEENKQAKAELQAKYQLEKKEKENERLRHTDQLNTIQIRNQQLLIGLVLVILLVSFVLSVLMHSRYQQNKKLNIELALKNKEIENQQKYVESLNDELQEANATKDKFFSIVAHDLKNPFNSLLVISQLLLDDYDTFTDTERKQFIHQIQSSAENTYLLLQNLLDWASTQSGKAIIIKEKIDLSKISNEATLILMPIAKNKNIKLNLEVAEKTFAFADKNMVSTVMLNLISNAVKFTSREGTINIRAFKTNNHVEVEIEDSGVGISPDNLDKLFKPDIKFHTVGTEKEKGTGLGLILCKEFVEKNNGTIWVESEPGKGSRFSFSLPLS